MGVLLAGAALVAAGTSAAPAAAVRPERVSLPAAGTPIAGSYIVVLEDGANLSAVLDAHRALGIEAFHVYRHALKGYAARMPAALAAVLAADPRVDFVEQDRVVRAAAQTLPTGINRVDADLSPTARINGSDERVNVDVAVIDTGVDLDHPDLNVYTAGAKNCIGVLALRGADDDNGHGSHVAGTIAALDNNTGVVGVAPGARIWPVKVLNFLGIGSVSNIVCGIDYVTSKASQIEVANMSLGGSGSDDGNCGKSNNDSEHRAICASVAAGVTYVVAAGNDSDNAENYVPASYDEVITVSALADFNGSPGGGARSTCRSDIDDTFANFSNYGADVDLIAPGVCIYSTSSGGGYATLSGTSMAAPHVAGAAALYKALNPGASPAQVKQALQAAGNLNWNNSDDGDAIKELLLNVANF
jgi:subtilisin family serine protease